MKRCINIIKNIKILPSFKLEGKEEEEKKYKSDLEKPKRIKREKKDTSIKYFIPL
jgi:hypothetical protein